MELNELFWRAQEAEALSFDTADKAMESYVRVRNLTADLVAPLQAEDFCVQAMPDVSPPKWHLAHVTWFFETFLLKPFIPDHQVFHPQYEVLFNSYYKGVGPCHPRDQRFLLTRPLIEDIWRYRQEVDDRVTALIASLKGTRLEQALKIIELGLHHEQQHQELLLTDIKYNFFHCPLFPSFEGRDARVGSPTRPMGFLNLEEGIYEVGRGEFDSFGYDNEGPRHKAYLHQAQIGDRLVTNAEFKEFIDAGGYQRPEFWLSQGWEWVCQQGVKHPLYWSLADDEPPMEYHLGGGWQAMRPHQPVCHVNYFEAHAYAAFVGARLPTEQEWEVVAAREDLNGSFLESGIYSPDSGGRGFFGEVWQWTQSAYAPYPGFKPLPGRLSEYNGKFMCGQYVLKGGSCFSPQSHIRPSYRNFFYPPDRWQMTGIRIVRDDT